MTRRLKPIVPITDETEIDYDFIEKIISRSRPVEDHEDLRVFLTNVLLFIKRIEGEQLTEEEKTYPFHSQFSHLTLRKGASTAEGLKSRLKIINRYQIDNVQQIVNIIASTAVSTPVARLTSRGIRIIEELHKNPLLTREKLAQQLGTTSQVIRKNLLYLRHHFSMGIINNLDYHKFKLAFYEINFRTKSLDVSEKLETHFRRTPPIFLRRINFDHNYRDGFLQFLIPDQPSGHKMLAERMTWLNSNFLEKSVCFRLHSLRIGISFDNYDVSKGAWNLNSENFSTSMLQFLSQRDHNSLPPREMIYTNPINFDKIDYILASTPYVFGEKQLIELRQKVLSQYGYTMSKKTIWNRDKRLQKARVYYPTLWYDTPELEELVKVSIDCSQDAIESIYRIIFILPYSYSVRTERGVSLSFHRPSLCSSIIGLLVQAFDQIKGVSNIWIIRYEPAFSPQLFTQTVNRWDESRQRWLLQTGDI